MILTISLLEGLDGVEKMSKSLDSYIDIQEAPGVMYNKLVSIPDTLTWCYFELFSFRSLDEIDSFRRDVEAGTNPRDIKIKLAEEIVTRFHDEEAVAGAHKSTGDRLKEGKLPEDLSEVRLSSPEDIPIASVLNKAGSVENAAATRDLLNAGGVKVNGQIVDRTFVPALGETHVFQAGKKVSTRITLKAE